MCGHVLFGEVQVIGHPRWIDPVQDVYVDPPPELVERGQAPPNLSSHDASYWPNWALRHSRQLDIHLAGVTKTVHGTRSLSIGNGSHCGLTHKCSALGPLLHTYT
jgi:hypothetical protein